MILTSILLKGRLFTDESVNTDPPLLPSILSNTEVDIIKLPLVLKSKLYEFDYYPYIAVYETKRKKSRDALKRLGS
jgi:hypothetical protein